MNKLFQIHVFNFLNLLISCSDGLLLLFSKIKLMLLLIVVNNYFKFSQDFHQNSSSLEIKVTRYHHWTFDQVTLLLLKKTKKHQEYH